jgi:putative component of membrane protein insertase Oxa1/YidC/SpoIIIJ protein YidD
MATKLSKLKDGSCRAVATCINYASKVKRDGNTNI